MEEEWIIKTGIIEETKIATVMTSMYTDLSIWARQWKNISVQFVDIAKENLQKSLDEELPEGSDWLFFPCDMSLFSPDRSLNSPRISPSVQSTSTYILSPTPNKKTVQSLNLIKMKPMFVWCLLASLVIISALMSFIRRLVRLRVSTLQNFGHQFLDNLWRISLLFFYEPFIRPPRILSWRIVVAVWLIAISFIYVDMCSHLNSKLTQTEYTFIDSVADLVQDRYRDIIVIKDFVEDRFINKMAEIDDNYRELKKRIKRVDETEFLVDIFSATLTTNALILAELVGKIGFKEISTMISEDPPRGLISFSQPLYHSHIVMPINRNASGKTVGAITHLFLMETENKLSSKYFNEMDFLFFGMKWTKPEEKFEDMTFADIKKLVDLFVIGLILASLIIIVEYFTSLLRDMWSFSPRRH